MQRNTHDQNLAKIKQWQEEIHHLIEVRETLPRYERRNVSERIRNLKNKIFIYKNKSV